MTITMRLFDDQDRAARAELREASAELDRVAAEDCAEAKRNGLGWWENVPESDAFRAANARVDAAIQALPWWKRIDIDHAAPAVNATGEPTPEHATRDADEPSDVDGDETSDTDGM